LYARDDSLAVYDTREKANPVCKVQRLFLGLPECSPIGFYGPGEIPSDQDDLFLTDLELCLLTIKIEVIGFDPTATFFSVVAFGDLFALASQGMETIVEFGHGNT